MTDLSNYRIHRVNKMNLAIQRWIVSTENPPGHWETQSYHGNSVKSLISGLLELAVSQHMPGDDKLPDQLKTMKLEIISMMDELERMIAEAGL